MPTIVLLIIFIVVVILLAKSFQSAQASQGGRRQPSVPRIRTRQPAKPRKPRPRRPAKPIDQAKLTEHVQKLRLAVDNDLISTEEAVASIVRHTEGQLSEDAAAQLLRSRDPA
jgi:hypothetical protein